MEEYLLAPFPRVEESLCTERFWKLKHPHLFLVSTSFTPPDNIPQIGTAIDPTICDQFGLLCCITKLLFYKIQIAHLVCCMAK